MSEGPVTSVEWDFGDGATSRDASPSHRYTIAGSYTVQLMVSGSGFVVGVAKRDLIAVQPGPAVSLEVSPPSVTLAALEGKQFTAVAKDEFGNVAPGDVTWAIAGEGGSITDRGLFTAGTIVGTFADSVRASLEADTDQLVAIASVTVEPGSCTSVVVEPPEVTLPEATPTPFPPGSFPARAFLAPAPAPDDPPRPLPDNVQLVATWGGRGAGDGQLDHPDGIAVDPFGDIYVADASNNRVQVFSADGQFLRKWGTPGGGDGEFWGPAGIAVGQSGNVYVADTGNHRVQVFTCDGRFLMQWGSFGIVDDETAAGEGDGRFRIPDGVAMDAAGNVYVSDLGNDRVQVFNSSGEFLAEWGSPGGGEGQFQGPHHLAIDRSGKVYVTDAPNRRVQVFSAGGEFLHSWGLPGGGEGVPHGITIDTSGNVYVTEAVNQNQVYVFSDSGELLITWGSTGTADGQFAGPQGIAVDGSGNVYVTDLFNSRVQVFRVMLP